MTKNDEVFKVPRLANDGSNWVTYKDRLRWALAARGILAHLEGDATDEKGSQSTARAGASDNTGTADKGKESTPDVKGTQPLKDAKWLLDEAVVKQCIASTVSDSVFNCIKSGTTAKEIWNSLTKIYQARSHMVAIDLRRRMQNKRCDEKTDIRMHFDELAGMLENLSSMGTSLGDEEYTSIILASLLDSYDSLITTMTTTATIRGEELLPDTVIQLVTDEYERRLTKRKGAKSAGAQDDAAFYSDDRKGGRGGPGGKRRNIECYNCKKRGHIKAECWAKGGGKEGQRPGKGAKTTDSTNAATEQDDEGVWTVIDDSDVESLSAVSSTDSWTDVDDEFLLGGAAVAEEPSTHEVISVTGDAAMTAGDGLTKGGVDSDLYDSGATRHMSPFRHRFLTFEEIEPRPITAADKREFKAIGKGTICIEVPNGDQTTSILLKDVLYTPSMGLNIISISRMAAAGYAAVFWNNLCRIFNPSKEQVGEIFMTANGLYRVDHGEVVAIVSEPVTKLTLEELHRRMGHIAPQLAKRLVEKGIVEGVELTGDLELKSCDSCEHAKSTRKEIRKECEDPPAERFGDEVHMDVWGPSPIESLGGRRYFHLLVDDNTRWKRVKTMRTKDESLRAYQDFEAWAETQFGVKIKRCHSDRGGEFTGGKFSAQLAAKGTERRLTTHDTPQHNGVAESANRRILEKIRALLHQSGLPKSLWGEALQHTTWLMNRTPTRILDDKAPFEALYRKKPNLGLLLEWGCEV